jgi:F-type H+-transporting ATPase subunit a
MHSLKAFLSLAILVLATLAGRGAEAPGDATKAVGAGDVHAEDAATHHESHGLPQAAPRLREGGLVSNSMVATWIIAAALILFARRAMKNAKPVPDGKQNFWEWMVESLHDFLEGIIGRELVKKTFWYFATVFIFILFANWAGLIPGVGTIGWGEMKGGHFRIDTPLFRGVNADLNMTLGMSMIFFVCWVVWAVQANGPGGFILHLFGPKGDTTGLLKYLMIFIFILAGLLEVVTILFRPVTLSFRLYGNIFAGENMLEAMSTMVPALGWLLPIPFYFLEVLVGFVQALVFMLLTAVFTLLICTEDEGHAHKKAHH